MSQISGSRVNEVEGCETREPLSDAVQSIEEPRAATRERDREGDALAPMSVRAPAPASANTSVPVSVPAPALVVSAPAAAPAPVSIVPPPQRGFTELTPTAASIADLRLLQCFVVVADELHFGRAAERLAIGRAAVMRTVELLERRLSVELLRRGTREVHLTAVGEKMLAGSRDLLEQHSSLVEDVERFARAERVAVNVAFDGGFAGLLLAAAVREYREISRGAEVRLQSAPNGSGAESLLAGGGVDFAVVGVPPGDVGVGSAVIARCRRVAVLPASHPLAGGESATLDELEGERELRAASSAPSWVAQWSIASLLGRAPCWGGEFELFAEALDLVASGDGVMLAPDVAELRFGRSDVVWLPIEGLDTVPIHLAWRRRNVPRERAKALTGAFSRAGDAVDRSLTVT